MKKVVKFAVWVHVEVPDDSPPSDIIQKADEQLNQAMGGTLRDLYHGANGCLLDYDEIEDEEPGLD